jgi:signal transduction histidine kinase
MKDNLRRLVPAFERELREAEVRYQKRQADDALYRSINDLQKQNAEYQILNLEYLSQNTELTESMDHIQKMNSELIVAKNKAEESDKLKSSFLANMSHEVRTPLNGILGFSSLLKDRGLTEEKADRYIDIIDSSGQQLLNIINDILDISKIEAGQISISIEVVNITQLMNELLQQFRHQAEIKNIDLILNSENLNKNMVINTDGNRLRQIIGNLLSNAIKFTSDGKVEFGLNHKGNYTEFYVSDSGIGIAPEDQSLIFKPFRKVETSLTNKYGGTGLGLSISKAFIEKLGGTITLQSDPNKGSKFTFTIPQTGIAQPDHQKHRETEPKLHRNWNQKTILIAEDEIFNFYYMEELLIPMSVNILHAWNGLEAVELAKENPDISLVLMDIKMPEMDGHTATKLIKALRPYLPVVAQTACASKEDKENAGKSGFDNYLTKPIERELFVQVIDKYLS